MIDISDAQFEPAGKEARKHGCTCSETADGYKVSLTCPLHWHFALINQNKLLSTQVKGVYEITKWQVKVIALMILLSFCIQLYFLFL